jgi:hypothetical protein
MGAILRRAGIEVSDEEVAEPPLETWVTDSMDKPDMDEAGNDPFTEEEKLMSMQQQEEKHAMQMAKASHEVALASSKADAAEHANDRSRMDEARTQEGHEQSMRHTDESHKTMMKTAAQPKEKTKTNG